jgi:hypothetical protein
VAADSGRRGIRRCRRPSEVEGFYDAALPEADKVALAVARDVQGLEQEIAVLRVRLRRALEDHPENMTLMIKGVELLVKALSASYRLSKDAKADLSESIKAMLEEYGGMIRPEGQSDVGTGEDD